MQIQRAEAAVAAEQAARNPPPPQPSTTTQPSTDSSTNPSGDADPSAPTLQAPKPVAKTVSTLGVPSKPGVPSRSSTPVPGAQPQPTNIVARPNDEELPRAPKPAPKLTPKQRILEEHQLVRIVCISPFWFILMIHPRVVYRLRLRYVGKPSAPPLSSATDAYSLKSELGASTSSFKRLRRIRRSTKMSRQGGCRLRRMRQPRLLQLCRVRRRKSRTGRGRRRLWRWTRDGGGLGLLLDCELHDLY